MMVQLLLASQSPRRRELIKLVGLPFSAISANVDESSITDPDPIANVIKTAELKANTIAAQFVAQTSHIIIIAADTTVVLDRQMLGKPQDETEARQMLLTLRGRAHEVHTGVALQDMKSEQVIEDVTTAIVTMRTYSHEEIAAYIATGDPLDKAGAYAIQHTQFSPVNHLEGCYLGVVGLSICHLLQMLKKLNITANPDLEALEKAHQGLPCLLLQDLLSDK